MQDFNLTIDFDLDVNTVTDCLPSDTFDVSSLKQESPDGPVLDVAPGDEELDERQEELATIEAFIAQNGVTRPTVEDFKPKKVSWRGKKSKKTDKQVEGERRGRPRTKYTKSLTFVCLNDGGTEFKRAGRGRGKVGEVRKTFDIHHTHVDTVSTGVWTLDQLVAMGVE
jgi:hypothetical protein